MQSPSRRASLLTSAVFAMLLVAYTLLLARPALSQMASTGAKDQPACPLPPGMKAPLVDFRDIAAQAGLSAIIVSGELEQTTVVENTGTGVAIFDYDHDGLPGPAAAVNEDGREQAGMEPRPANMITTAISTSSRRIFPATPTLFTAT